MTSRFNRKNENVNHFKTISDKNVGVYNLTLNDSKIFTYL